MNPSSKTVLTEIDKSISVTSLSEAGFVSRGKRRKNNEDSLILGKQTWGIIDGAAPREEYLVGGATAAEHLSQTISAEIIDLDHDPRYTSFEAWELLAKANDYYGNLNSQIVKPASSCGKSGPAASFAAIKLHADRTYSWSQSGDTYLVEVSRLGKFLRINQEVNTSIALEQERLKLVREGLVRGLSVEQVRNTPDYLEILSRGHSGRNVAQSCLNGEPAFAKLVARGRRDRSAVCALIMFSDGAILPGETAEENIVGTGQQIFVRGVEPYVGDMYKMYDADPTFEKFIRFKHIDDISVMTIVF